MLQIIEKGFLSYFSHSNTCVILGQPKNIEH
jgi:hypothetical protein